MRSVEDSAGRPFWSGTISFGLVSVPVNLFPAVRDSHVPLRMLGPDNEPLHRQYYSDPNGRPLESEETVRGFELSKGKYVTLTNEELEKLAPDKSRDIDLRLFVKRRDISPLYFDRPYFLAPSGKSGKAYRLLAEAMRRGERAGLGTFVMRGKEYLVAIVSESGVLIAETLRFGDEIRKPEAVGLPRKKHVSAGAIRKFKTAVSRNMKSTLNRDEMRDEYADAMMKLIEKKKTKHDGVAKAKNAGERKAGPEKVVDLMEVLKRSIGQSRSRRAA